MTADAVASIGARLPGRARSAGTEFELFLVRYACDRFLYQLGESAVRDSLVTGRTFDRHWPAGGPCRAAPAASEGGDL